MKAGILKEVNKLIFEETETPLIGDDDILVKIKSAAICGTDLRIYHGKKTKGIRYPSIIGHEFSGEIIKKGLSVKDFNLGDRVTVDPVLPDNSCFYCQNGMENVCQNREALGYEYNGCFAEYIKIPGKFIKSGNVLKVPETISWESAALAEPLSCVINGQRKLDIIVGDTVLIIGAGPIGIMHMMIARAAGASKIIISEPSDYRRETAKNLGADEVINPLEKDLVQFIKDKTNGLGVDVVILAIGNPHVINDAFNSARKGGRVSMFAGFTKGVKADIDVNLIHYNELRVVGSSSLQRRDMKIALNLIEKGLINVEQLITKTFPLSQINDAFESAESGKAIKVVIKP